jgi:RNA polymerase sigma-70 factor (ECF subfamily)
MLQAGILDLFDVHAPGLYRLASALLHDADAAQDVVQDTFVKLMQHVNAGGSLPNAKGWLYTVTAHGCRDRQRSGWRWLPWLADRDRRTSSDTPDAAGRRRDVLAALARLGARDRLLIALRSQGLTYEEIAGVASIRAASVGRLLARALDRLGRQLGPTGEYKK